MVSNGGVEAVLSGGIATDTAVGSGGYQNVFGSADDTEVSDGFQYVHARAARAVRTMLRGGGFCAYVASGADMGGVTIDGVSSLEIIGRAASPTAAPSPLPAQVR